MRVESIRGKIQRVWGVGTEGTPGDLATGTCLGTVFCSCPGWDPLGKKHLELMEAKHNMLVESLQQVRWAPVGGWVGEFQAGAGGGEKRVPQFYFIWGSLKSPRALSRSRRPGPTSRSRAKSCRCAPPGPGTRASTSKPLRGPITPTRPLGSPSLSPCPAGVAGEGDEGCGRAGCFAARCRRVRDTGPWGRARGAYLATFLPTLASGPLTQVAHPGGTRCLTGCRTARARSWRRWPRRTV